MSTSLLHNTSLCDARGVVEEGWVLFDETSILATGSGTGELPDADDVIDGQEGYVTPGFVDIHRHGGGGFSNEDGVMAMLGAADAHQAAGTTRALASLVSAPLEQLEGQLAVIADVARRDARILGSHLEGPFLATARCGAHDPRHLTHPTPDAVRRLLAAADGTLRQVTVDPQLPGATDAIGMFREAGVIVAVGHTEAGYDDAQRAFAAGASVLTHAFNAMPGLHHRAPGPVLAAVDSGHVTLELILDGHHVDLRLARALIAMAPGRVALVTDAMAASRADEGDYRLGALNVNVRNGRAQIAGTDTLAGSTLDQLTALHTALSIGIPTHQAVEALTLTPTRAIEASGIGLLEPGYVPDILLFDRDWSLREVRTSHAPGLQRTSR